MKTIKASLIVSGLDRQRAVPQSEEFRKEINSFMSSQLQFVDSSMIEDEKCKFIFIASGGSEPAFLEIFRRTKGPWVLITTQSNNSLPAAMEILSYINDHGQKGEILHGSAKSIASRLELIARCYDTITRLENYHIGVLGSPNMLINSEYDVDTLKKSSGISTTYITMDEICSEIDKKAYESDEYTEKLCKSGFDSKELEKAFWIYGAVCRLIEKYHFDAISLRCFDLLAPYKASGCLALAILNSRGIPAACEGDTRSLLSMVVMNTLTGQPCFMANPSRIDMEKKEMILAHCTLPLTMVGSYSLTTHFESGLSVAVKGNFSEGTYTLFKCCEDMTTYFTQKVEFVSNLNECDLCRTQVKLRVEDVASYMTGPLSNHQILVRGDWSEDIRQLFACYDALK